MNYSNSNSINSQINSLRTDSDITMSNSNSNVDKYYVEDGLDAIFFANIDSDKLKKRWFYMNTVLKDKLNCQGCLEEIRKCYFIGLPKTYTLAIDFEIGKKGKGKMLNDNDYVYCNDLTSIFSVIIKSSSKITPFRLFHLSFHSIRPKAISTENRLRANKRNIICTRFEKQQHASLGVAPDAEHTEGAIHIKIDNLIFLGITKERLNEAETLFKRIIFDENNQKLEYLTQNFGNEDNIDLKSYVSKISKTNLEKDIDTVIRDLTSQLGKATKAKNQDEIAILTVLINEKTDNKSKLEEVLLIKSEENIQLVKVISSQVLLSFNENLSSILR
jgi:hypothetical protein